MFGVWVIGYSDLDIVCYLLFVIWSLEFYSINHSTKALIKVFLAPNTSGPRQRIPEIGVAVSAKINWDVIQIRESP